MFFIGFTRQLTSRHFTTRLLIVLLMIVPASTSSSVAEAQVPAVQATREEREAAERKLETQALKLLDGAIAEAATLKVAENRALVRAIAGDLLWKRDAPRARSLMRDALADLAQIKTKVDRRRGGEEWMEQRTREQVLGLVARRDPRLALDAVRSLRASAEADGVTGISGADAYTRLEQSLATQAAADNPELALQLAEESLKKGVSFGALNSLGALRRSSPELSAKFVDKVVERLRTEDLRTNHEAGNVAALLLQMGTQQRGATLSASGSASPARPLAEEQRRELVQMLSTAAASAPAGSYMLYSVQQIMPEIERFAPARAETLRRKIAQFEQTLDPRERAYNEFGRLTRTGDVEAMLEAAPRMPTQVRGQLYGAAAMKLLEKGESDRARQVVTENVRDSGERRRMLAMIDRQIAERLIAADKIADARKTISGIRDKQERARMLTKLADAALAKKDEKLAREILDEAYEFVRGEASGDTEVEAQLQVARGYALVAPERTFEIVDSLVERANEMLAAAGVLDKFGGAPQGLFKSGEVVLTSAYVGANSMFYRYVRELKALARADFRRTETSLDAFRREEVRSLAKLLLVQGILMDEADVGKGISNQVTEIGDF